MNLLYCTSFFKVLAFICGHITVSASKDQRRLDNPLLENWGKEEELANFLHDKIESTKTTSPTLGPTTENPTSEPTERPTEAPTPSPSEFPSENPTESPTDEPSMSFHPSMQPTIYPTPEPSIAPSLSAMPTAVPSFEPTEMPSNSPSVSPTAAPSHGPSLMPSAAPSVSQEPSLVPSSNPSVVSTLKPSFGPSEIASGAPSLLPSISPTQSPSSISPTQSPTDSMAPSKSPVESKAIESSIIVNQTTTPTQSPKKSMLPSESPTETKVMESSVPINQNNRTRNATPLLIVGAACFLVMVSTSMYLYSKGVQSRQDKCNRAPSMIEVSAGDPKSGGGMVSPWSIAESLGPMRTFDDVNYCAESVSHVTDGDTLDHEYKMKERRFENVRGMVDIDLEAGHGGNDEVPISVSIFKQSQPSEIEEDNHLSNVIQEPTTPESSRVRMPKSIYVPKMFQRTKGGGDCDKQVITWNEIREEDRSHASSGYAPASASSPMLSPFLVKGLSSILSPHSSRGRKGSVRLIEPSGDETEGDEAADTPGMLTGQQDTLNGVVGETVKSSLDDIVCKREKHRQSDDVFAGLEDTPIKNVIEGSSDEQKSSDTVRSNTSDGSTIEWGIDVPKLEQPSNAELHNPIDWGINAPIAEQPSSAEVQNPIEWGINTSKGEQPSKATFEANMAELQNLLVSIKSMGSNDASTREGDVDMTYTDTEDSTDPNHASVNQPNDKADQISPKSDSSAYPRNIDPIESNSTQSQSSSVHSFHPPPQATQPESGITYERELLNSTGMNSKGAFNFRNIFNDPKNDLYQCHAPSGPLGIVVDTTPLGPRVRSMNPLSPIFGKISPGDVIVGVDEVDTVGMEAGDFWQIVSQKANQQERILTILRI